jgi:glycosyltransferase involved in cell wall biosynthesis
VAKAIGTTHIPLVVDDHMHMSVVRRSSLGRAFYAFHRKAVQPVLSRQVDRFCAISDDTRNYLREFCGVQGDIELRPLGVDTDAFRPSVQLRQVWRKRLDIGVDDLVIAYVGKIIEPKGPHVLADAALKLLTRGDEVKVVMVGDSGISYLAGIKKSIDDAGRADAFRFSGSIPHAQLPGVYAAADVAVWPRQESMAVFEAMATAIPVVISSRSGYRTLTENAAGLTFEHDDPSALAEVLRSLFDAERRGRLGTAGRELVERDYSWRRSAERYIETYTEAARTSVAAAAR